MLLLEPGSNFRSLSSLTFSRRVAWVMALIFCGGMFSALAFAFLRKAGPIPKDDRLFGYVFGFLGAGMTGLAILITVRKMMRQPAATGRGRKLGLLVLSLVGYVAGVVCEFAFGEQLHPDSGIHALLIALTLGSFVGLTKSVAESLDGSGDARALSNRPSGSADSGAIEAGWLSISDELHRELLVGAEPSTPRVQELARQWIAYLRLLVTECEPTALRRALGRCRKAHGVDLNAVMQYVSQAGGLTHPGPAP